MEKKRRRRLNMCDVIAEEIQLEKQPIVMLQPNTRARVARETQPHTTSMENIIQNHEFVSQSQTSNHNSRAQVALFQTPTCQISQNVEQTNDPLENVDPPCDDMPLDGDEPAGTESTPTCAKKGRKGAKPWIEWNNNKKKILEWNELCQPVCRLECKLMSQLGYYARNGIFFPLTMLSWDEADEKTLNAIWDEVKDNTNAPEGFKQICFAKMGTAWRQWKHRVKKNHYEKFQTDQERLKHFPPRVNRDQWPILVQYWGLQKTIDEANQNSKNREGKCAYSRTGRKPHAKITKERIERGEPVDDISIWRATRAPNNKSFNIEDGSSDREAMLERQLNALPEEKLNDPEARNKIFREVVGKGGHGYTLLKGVGIRPTSTRASSSSQALLEEINQLKKDAEDWDTRHKQKLEELESHHQQELQQIKADMRGEMHSLLQSAGIIIPHHASSTSVSHVD